MNLSFALSKGKKGCKEGHGGHPRGGVGFSRELLH